MEGVVPTSWCLQDAKNQFSKVVEAATHGKPQHVTKHGREVVVIISAAEYYRLEKFNKASLPGFVGHLLAIPKDDGEFERLPFTTREVEF
jgi:prevent-host-death family protein